VGHLVQPSCWSRVTYSRLHRTLSRRVLNISREGDSTMRSTCTYSRGHYLAHLPLLVIHFDSGLWSHSALFILLASGIFAAPAYFWFLLFLSLWWTGIQTLQIHQVIMDGQEWLMSCVSFGVVLDVDILQTVVFCGILDWSAARLCPPHIVWWLWLINHIYCSCHVREIWRNNGLFPFFPFS